MAAKKRDEKSNESWVLLTWKNAGNFLEEVQFDVVTAESYEAVMAVSRHPVERGAPVVDHARPEPVRFQIEGFISNTPLPSNIRKDEREYWGSGRRPLTYSSQKPEGPPLLSPGALTGAVTKIVSNLISPEKPLPKSVDAFGAQGNAVDRAKNVLELLEEARNTRALVMVSTRYHDIPDMLIERIAVDRTAESSGGLPFQIELTQIRIVDSEEVHYAEPSQPRATPEKKMGSQQPVASVLHNATFGSSDLANGSVDIGSLLRGGR